MIPFPIPPGGWVGKVLETPPPVEFSSFWVGGWERYLFTWEIFSTCICSLCNVK
jgi:hypothetical protein